jgi:hypothetical protein
MGSQGYIYRESNGADKLVNEALDDVFHGELNVLPSVKRLRCWHKKDMMAATLSR